MDTKKNKKKKVSSLGPKPTALQFSRHFTIDPILFESLLAIYLEPSKRFFILMVHTNATNLRKPILC
jgi:hypothetical protein